MSSFGGKLLKTHWRKNIKTRKSRHTLHSRVMKLFTLGLLLPLLQPIFWAEQCTVEAACPDPFYIEAGRCVHMKRLEMFTWCEANRQCQAIGGELINNYESLKVLNHMPSASCSGCKLWYGLSDLADERDTLKGGWQRIMDNGVLPYNTSLWYMGMPSSNGNQDCIASSAFTVQFIDGDCADVRGFICEYVKPPKLFGIRKATWTRTQFKRTSYNPSGKYCFKEVQVDSLIECAAAATADDSARRVLFNTNTKRCRLLQFTDAQVDEWIETGANWIKLSI